MTSPLLEYQGYNLVPGHLPPVEAIESDLTSVVWGRLEQQVIGYNALIDEDTVDSGNTGYTHVLRPGLLLTKTASGDKFTTWGSVVNTSTDLIQAVLLFAQNMGQGTTKRNRFVGYVMVGGNVKEKGIIIPGNTTPGIDGDALETTIRSQMVPSFRFDDDPLGHLTS